jgi:small-conductance mechanosensitive channel
MHHPPVGTVGVGLVETALESFVADLTAAIPKIVSGLVFLAMAGLLIRLVTTVVRAGLRRALPAEPIYVQFVTTVVSVFLWFAVLLSFLSIVGLGQIAASLGTAVGFVALGVSYAVSGMIADAVAGVYLLRDPDFNPGDTITADDVTGEVQAIELRKTRLDVDGDRVVKANSDIEGGWTKVSSAGPSQ